MTENGYGLGLCYEGKNAMQEGTNIIRIGTYIGCPPALRRTGKTVQAEDDIALLAESEWVFCSFSIALGSFLK